MSDAEEYLPPQEGEEKEDRSFGALGTVLLAILVIVLVLLFWRSCGTRGGQSSASGGGGVIESLQGKQQFAGAIAVWVRPGTNVDDVLARNGLSGATATAFGDGTYVIDIGTKDSGPLVEQLKKDPGLYDAGFLYTDATGTADASGTAQ